MKDSRWSKPLFNVALGTAETSYLVVPPFSFPGVTARFFPLPAKMDILSSFCQRYLNVAPKKICFLRPYIPYVFLAVLDYGQEVIETANLGWVSQHEVYFAVPLERWHRRKGRMVFDGWVLNTPFIFVDNASSVTTGREVYGWPKVLASLRPNKESWLVAPRAPTPLLSLSIEGLGTRDAGKVPLLEIVQGMDQDPSLPSAALASVDPFPKLSRILRGARYAGVSLATLLLQSPFSGFGPRTAECTSLAEVLFASLRRLFDFTRNPGVDVVTLKQFRDARVPLDICYQALVRSRLAWGRYNDGGPLGFSNLLQGDATGGFRIRLYDNSLFPIASSLGLHTVREPAGGGSPVSILEPMFPFWLNVDLTYRRGENLGWRTFASPWYGKDAEIVRSSRSGDDLYDTVAGAGQQEWISPYQFPTSSCDIYPLRVYDEHKLDRFISDYLNHRGELHFFKRLGRYVYLAASRSRFFSQARSAMVSQIAVYVPLLWYEQGKLKGVVVAKPYAFVDDPIDAVTMREVQGIPAIDATIETPAHSWLRQGPVLRMKTDVFPVLDAGVGAERRTLLEVVVPSPSGWSAPPSGGPRKVCGPVEVPVLTLKQFPDARDPALACYQALILEPWKMSLMNPQPLGAGTQIRIYQYPSLLLATTLGLVDPARPPVVSHKKKRRVMVNVLAPECPFRIELDVTVERAEVLSRTAGNLPWIERPIKEGSGKKGPNLIEILCEGPQAVIAALLDADSGCVSPDR